MRFQRSGKIGLAVLAAALGAAGAASAASCSNATLNGGYGLISTGNQGSGQPTAGVYRITADGNGNITGSGTQSTNGTIQTATFNGTYGIAKSCTGTITLTDQTDSVSDFAIVFDDKDSHFEFIRTDPGFNQSGEGRAIGTASCSSSGKKEVYSKRLKGHVIGEGPVDIVGQMTVAATGKLTAVDTFAVNGVVTSQSLKGTYSGNSDCTGTAQLKGTGTTYHFATIIVDAGKNVMLIETDANAVVSGMAVAE